jgi:predicted extracellular nuclease
LGPVALSCALSCGGDVAAPLPSFTGTDAAAPIAGPLGADASREGMIRVAAFNVRRYFDTVCDSGACGPADFEALPSQVEFEAKTERLANGIAALQADVIALEEIETQGCLDALVARLARKGASFPVAHLGETGAPASVDVAVLSRGTQPEIRTHRDVPLLRPDGTATTFSRELLEVRTSFGARRVVMFAAHFRSKVDDDPGRRVAEANGARDIVSAVAVELPDALVVLGGDLNDTPGSEALDALERGGALVRVARDIPPAAQATYFFQGAGSAIDHLHVAANQARRYVAGSARVHLEGTSGWAGSDHGAIEASFFIE